MLRVLKKLGFEKGPNKKDKDDNFEQHMGVVAVNAPCKGGNYSSSVERSFDRRLTQNDLAARMRKGRSLSPQMDVKIS